MPTDDHLGNEEPADGEKPVAESGRVKWFDAGRGFGFVTAGDLEEGASSGDILLHANVLRAFGRSSIAEGTQLTFVSQETPRGRQIGQILTANTPPDVDALPDDVRAIPLAPARVKWFDPQRGFGFANAFGESADVFVHMDVLRRSGLAALQPGEAIAVRVRDGARGRMAADVRAWDEAAQDTDGSDE